MLRHWSQFVSNMSTGIRGHETLHHHQSGSQSLTGVIGLYFASNQSASLNVTVINTDRLPRRKAFFFKVSGIRPTLRRSVCHADDRTTVATDGTKEQTMERPMARSGRA